jgi:hypothetical protein
MKGGPWRHWSAPFVWLIASLILTDTAARLSERNFEFVSATSLHLTYGSHWMKRDDLLASFVPSLVTFGAGFWLLNARARTRWAAAWATGFASLVMLEGVVIVAALSLRVSTSGLETQYVDWHEAALLLWIERVQVIFTVTLGFLLFGTFVSRRDLGRALAGGTRESHRAAVASVGSAPRSRVVSNSPDHKPLTLRWRRLVEPAIDWIDLRRSPQTMIDWSAIGVLSTVIAGGVLSGVVIIFSVA